MKYLSLILILTAFVSNAQVKVLNCNVNQRLDTITNKYITTQQCDSVLMQPDLQSFISDIQSDTTLFTFISNNAKPNGFYAFMNQSEYVQTNFLYLLRLCNLTFDPYNKERFNYYLRKNFFAIQI